MWILEPDDGLSPKQSTTLAERTAVYVESVFELKKGLSTTA